MLITGYGIQCAYGIRSRNRNCTIRDGESLQMKAKDFCDDSRDNLALITVIMVVAPEPKLCLAENEIVQNVFSLSFPSSLSSSISSSLLSKMVLNRWKNKKENLVEVKERNVKSNQNLSKRKSYLNPIVIKLDNVIAKYEMKRSYLENIYMGVVGCGLSRCEKFKNLIPENQRLRRLHCFKRKKNGGFKKMISNLLSSFHNGVQRVDKSIQLLINFERWPNLSNRSRRKILEEFKIDIKTLNIEIETVMANKRLNFDKEPSIPVLSHIQKPENQTHLMIYEWRIIQASKKFLRDWQKNLRKMSKCWRRRRQKKKEKEMAENELAEPKSAKILDHVTVSYVSIL